MLCNVQIYSLRDKILLSLRLRPSQMVKASGCQCQSRSSPGFEHSILHDTEESEGRQMKQCWIKYRTVLQIRDVYPGSDFFPSRILIKKFKYFNPKKWLLSSMKYDPGCSSRIRILTFYPSRIPDPGVKKAPDAGSGSATLVQKKIQESPPLRRFRGGGRGERQKPLWGGKKMWE